jgi:ribonuclease R
MVIRSMAKADYGVDNIGHYGLSFEDYTHFTSPIRRYPDVLVHRLVAAYMDGQKAYSEQEMQRLARHCSLQERQAVDAERASIRFMQALYLQRYIGKAFMGKVSGVTNFGVFVRLDENHCEGLVLLRSMDDDHYVFKSEQQMVVGQRHGFTYRIGDEVEVRILDADPLSRQVDLVML